MMVVILLSKVVNIFSKNSKRLRSPVPWAKGAPMGSRDLVLVSFNILAGIENEG